jgi:Zn-dependent protease with chaperone function
MFILMLLADAAMPLDNLTSLGAAGLMGAMWLWERKTSQTRETQIDEAHARIMGDRVQLDQLIDVVSKNAEAISRLSATQDQFLRQLSISGGLATSDFGELSRGVARLSERTNP